MTDPASLPQTVTLDFQHLSSTKVYKYSVDAITNTASVTFMVTSDRTRAFRTYTSEFVATSGQLAGGQAAIVQAAYTNIWTVYHDAIVAFVADEATKPALNQYLTVPIYAPTWVTPSTATYALQQTASIQLVATSAVAYTVVGSSGLVPATDGLTGAGLLTLAGGTATGQPAWSAANQPTVIKIVDVAATGAGGSSQNQQISVTFASDLVIATSTIAVNVGVPISVQLAVTNAVSYSASSFMGLSVSSTGLVTGTPADPYASGSALTFVYAVSVTSANPLNNIVATFQLVYPPAPVWVTAASLTYPLGASISLQLQATNATTYQLVSSTNMTTTGFGGPGPEGVSSIGVLTLVPANLGVFTSAAAPVIVKTAVVKAIAGTGAYSTHTIAVTMQSDLVINSSSIAVSNGTYVAFQLSVTNAVSYSSPAFPAGSVGLAVSSTGLVTGTPANPDPTNTIYSYPLTVTVNSVNPLNSITSAEFTVQFPNTTPVWVTGATLSYPLTSAVSYQLVATGAVSYALTSSTNVNVNQTLSSGSAAEGVTSAGVLFLNAGSASNNWSSTNQPSYTKTVTVKATAATGAHASQTITITQASDLVIVTPTTISVTNGVPLSYQIHVTNAVSFTDGGQDAALGLSLSSAGLLTGTPTNPDSTGAQTSWGISMTANSSNPLNDVSLVFTAVFPTPPPTAGTPGSFVQGSINNWIYSTTSTTPIPTTVDTYHLVVRGAGPLTYQSGITFCSAYTNGGVQTMTFGLTGFVRDLTVNLSDGTTSTPVLYITDNSPSGVYYYIAGTATKMTVTPSFNSSTLYYFTLTFAHGSTSVLLTVTDATWTVIGTGTTTGALYPFNTIVILADGMDQYISTLALGFTGFAQGALTSWVTQTGLAKVVTATGTDTFQMGAAPSVLWSGLIFSSAYLAGGTQTLSVDVTGSNIQLEFAVSTSPTHSPLADSNPAEVCIFATILAPGTFSVNSPPTIITLSEAIGAGVTYRLKVTFTHGSSTASVSLTDLGSSAVIGTGTVASIPTAFNTMWVASIGSTDTTLAKMTFM